jgi:hypothetical protein
MDTMNLDKQKREMHILKRYNGYDKSRYKLQREMHILKCYNGYGQLIDHYT